MTPDDGGSLPRPEEMPRIVAPCGEAPDARGPDTPDARGPDSRPVLPGAPLGVGVNEKVVRWVEGAAADPGIYPGWPRSIGARAIIEEVARLRAENAALKDEVERLQRLVMTGYATETFWPMSNVTR